jgi:hypothetical protein
MCIYTYFPMTYRKTNKSKRSKSSRKSGQSKKNYKKGGKNVKSMQGGDASSPSFQNVPIHSYYPLNEHGQNDPLMPRNIIDSRLTVGGRSRKSRRRIHKNKKMSGGLGFSDFFNDVRFPGMGPSLPSTNGLAPGSTNNYPSMPKMFQSSSSSVTNQPVMNSSNANSIHRV